MNLKEYYALYWTTIFKVVDFSEEEITEWQTNTGNQLLNDIPALSHEEPWFWILDDLVLRLGGKNVISHQELFDVILDCNTTQLTNETIDLFSDKLRKALGNIKERENG